VDCGSDAILAEDAATQIVAVQRLVLAPAARAGDRATMRSTIIFRPVVPTITQLDAKIDTRGARRECAVLVTGTAASGERLRLAERYAVAPRHVLLISAVGNSEAFDANTAAIVEWFEGARFGAIRGR